MIEVTNITKDYSVFDRRDKFKRKKNRQPARLFRAVDNVSFTISPGEMVGYIGPNGAGKSTTIKMMCGILTPTSGRLEMNGVVPYEKRQENAKQIGVIFGQKSQLWWDLPITSSLRLYQKMYEIPEAEYKARYEELREMLDLADFESRPVRTLSLGQRMRGELAAAVLHRPPVLILDEPTIGMDIVVKERIRSFLQELNRAYGTTILLTTHDMTDIEKVCSRAILINKGQKIFDGSLESLKHDGMADSRVTVRLERPMDPGVQAKLRGLETPGASTYIFSMNRRTDENELLGKIINDNRIIDLYISEPTLEEEISAFLGRR